MCRRKYVYFIFLKPGGFYTDSFCYKNQNEKRDGDTAKVLKRHERLLAEMSENMKNWKATIEEQNSTKNDNLTKRDDELGEDLPFSNLIKLNAEKVLPSSSQEEEEKTKQENTQQNGI